MIELARYIMGAASDSPLSMSASCVVNIKSEGESSDGRYFFLPLRCFGCTFTGAGASMMRVFTHAPSRIS
jgi:hypothetical protein